MKMMPGTPAIPLSKIRRNLYSTPGGSKVHEEKILVTVRLRPLNRREQAMYDLIAWDCLDEHTIVFKNPNHERPANPYTFGISYIKSFIFFLCFHRSYSVTFDNSIKVWICENILSYNCCDVFVFLKKVLFVFFLQGGAL